MKIMENDYSQIEIDNIVNELMDIHISKLKPEEIYFLDMLSIQDKINQEQRDILIKLYDSIGEAGY